MLYDSRSKALNTGSAQHRAVLQQCARQYGGAQSSDTVLLAPERSAFRDNLTQKRFRSKRSYQSREASHSFPFPIQGR